MKLPSEKKLERLVFTVGAFAIVVLVGSVGVLVAILLWGVIAGWPGFR